MFFIIVAYIFVSICRSISLTVVHDLLSELLHCLFNFFELCV